MKTPKDDVESFAAISGLNFPFRSRKYFMNLVADVVKADDCKFILIVGNAIAGRELESELKNLIKMEGERIKRESEDIKARNRTVPEGEKKEPLISFGPEDRERLERAFVEELAHEFSDFLPVIKDVNYHIQIAEKVFDRPIGVKILERLQEIRGGTKGDIRLINDTEAKVPFRMAGVDDIRSIVPRRVPWFYKIITGLMQRNINSFVSRTFSPRPSAILTGCTGAGAYLPFYEGVPCISVPALNKIDEQLSTENMIGAVTVKFIREDGRVRIKPKTYDWRPVIFNERNYLIEENPSAGERVVLEALKPSSASSQVINFRINEGLPKKKRVSDKKIADAIDSLLKRKIVRYNKRSNRYEINEEILGNAKISLADLMKGGRLVKHVVVSCRHIGALKSLYHTANRDLPKLLEDADAFIDAGDSIQGIAHDFEYSGELLPIVNGFDKQEILAAYVYGKNIMDTFRLRLAKIKGKPGVEALIRECLLDFRFVTGNHPAWITHTRHALVLQHFEDLLKHLLMMDILHICRERGYQNVDPDMVQGVVNEKVVRVGEDNITEVDGVKIAVKHPSKSRTLSKSQRVQEVINYIYGAFYALVDNIEKRHPNVTLAYVGNFHEAAAVFVSKFGRTLFGVMVGAYLKDTKFEVEKDKVVDIGPAKVWAYLNRDGQIVWAELEYVNGIHPDDQKLVLAKRVTTKMVLELCGKLTEIYDLPWR